MRMEPLYTLLGTEPEKQVLSRAAAFEQPRRVIEHLSCSPIGAATAFGDVLIRSNALITYSIAN